MTDWGGWDKPKEDKVIVEQVKPIEGPLQPSNVKWITKEEAEEKYPVIPARKTFGQLLQQVSDKAVEVAKGKDLEVHIDYELELNINRRVQVKGTRVGDLLVHQSVKNWDEWQVSHIPTLVHFMKAVVIGRVSGKTALKLKQLAYFVKLLVHERKTMLYATTDKRMIGWLRQQFPHVRFDQVEMGIEINMDKMGKL